MMKHEHCKIMKLEKLTNITHKIIMKAVERKILEFK